MAMSDYSKDRKLLVELFELMLDHAYDFMWEGYHVKMGKWFIKVRKVNSHLPSCISLYRFNGYIGALQWLLNQKYGDKNGR